MYARYRKTYADHTNTLINKFERQLASSRRSPKDRQVHDLRVSIRRIRAALQFVDDKNLPVKKLDTELKALGKVLGKRRELDVAADDSLGLQLDNGLISKKRKEAKKRLKNCITPRKRKKLRKRLEKVAKKIEKRSHPSFLTAFSMLHQNLTKWKDDPIRDPKQIHLFRILIKKSRYALESVGAPVKPLADIQGHLGRAHDLEVLEQFVGPRPQIKKLEKKEMMEAGKSKRASIRFALRQIKRIISEMS